MKITLPIDGTESRNPWTNIKETERWVARKVEESGTRIPYLSTCEWGFTVVIGTIISTLLYMERAVQLLTLVKNKNDFGWTLASECALVLVFYIGYLLAQLTAGYLVDHRLDIISSVSGVDSLTGDVVLNTPVEKALGGYWFGANSFDMKEEAKGFEVDSINQPANDVSSPNGVQNKKLSRRNKRIAFMKQQLGLQYTKYGSRWIAGFGFFCWSCTVLAHAVMSTALPKDSKLSLLVFMAIRLWTGICDGMILVALQGIVATECPPKARTTASGLLGAAMPLGSGLGAIIRLSIDGNNEDQFINALAIIGAGSICFCIIVFLWLTSELDEKMERDDLFEFREVIEKKVRSDPEAADKNAGSWGRTFVRIFFFSKFEAMYLFKFNPIRVTSLASFFWAFSMFSMTSWLPSAVHSHKDFMDEIKLANLLSDLDMSMKHLSKAEANAMKKQFATENKLKAKQYQEEEEEDSKLHPKVGEIVKDLEKDLKEEAEEKAEDDSVSEILDDIKKEEKDSESETDTDSSAEDSKEDLEDSKDDNEEDSKEEEKEGDADLKESVSELMKNLEDGMSLDDISAALMGLKTDRRRLRGAPERQLSAKSAKLLAKRIKEAHGRKKPGRTNQSYKKGKPKNKSEARQIIDHMKEAQLNKKELEKHLAEKKKEKGHLKAKTIVDLKESIQEEGQDVAHLGFTQHEDKMIELDDFSQILAYNGMVIMALVATGMNKYLGQENGLSIRKAWAPSVVIGGFIPGFILLHVALVVNAHEELTLTEHDTQMKQVFNEVITAIVMSGALIPWLYSTQNLVAPFKAGSVYSVFSFWGTLGDISGVLFSAFLPTFVSVFGTNSYAIRLVFVSAASLIASCLYWLTDFSIIEDLVPQRANGEAAEKMKYALPVEQAVIIE